jgi:hypothetical protein
LRTIAASARYFLGLLGADRQEPIAGASVIAQERGADRRLTLGHRIKIADVDVGDGRASHLGKRCSKVSSTVEDAVDRHPLGADVEGNGDRPLEADHAQPGPDVVASGAPLGKRRKPQTGRLDTLDIGQGAVAAALLAIVS